MIPISILIPTKNEERNIERCLIPILDWADEIVIVDSNSTDKTTLIAKKFGVDVTSFTYNGGWPKKRQWALDNYNFRNDWILLLDSDEILLDDVKKEIEKAISSNEYDGYWLRFQVHFLGKLLRYGGTELWKLSLFRKGLGFYEKRLENQDESMADMEIHEHVVVQGKVGKIYKPIRHENINSLSRYIEKHNEYSNWEASLIVNGSNGELKAKLFGSQAGRRRWLRKIFANRPLSFFYRFIHIYILKLGFLDGLPGFVHAGLKGVQHFHIWAKTYEMKKLK